MKHLMNIGVAACLALAAGSAAAATLRIDASGSSQTTPGGGTVTTSDWSLVFDDVSGDGLLQVDEIVSFSGTTVATTFPSTAPITYIYDAIVGTPAVAGVSTASGSFSDCCWWFTGTVTDGVQDGWFPSRWTYTVNPVSAQSLLTDLVTTVVNMNLARGLGNALDSRLQNTLAALDRARSGDAPAALGMMHAFINTVEAQRGRELTNAQADQLIAAATAIIAALEAL